MDCPGYAYFYRHSGYGAFPQEHRRQNGRWPFEMIQITQGAHDFSDPAVDETVIAMPLTSSARTWAWNMGSGWRSETAAARRIMVLPPDTPSDWRVDGEREILLCVVPTITFKRIFGHVCPRELHWVLRPLGDSTLRDTYIESTLLALWSAAQGTCALERIRCEGLLTALLAHLLLICGVRDYRVDDESSSRISPLKLRRLDTFVKANLAQDLGLDDLAALTDLSVRQFARAFRNSVGNTPHRWLIERRVEVACEMLTTSGRCLAEVALACGFSSQAHFTTVFRQHIGMTPHRWRARHRAESIENRGR